MKTIKNILATSLILMHLSVAIGEEKAPKLIREPTEWCDVWIPAANRPENPRVLLVGDSIAKGYYWSVAKTLADDASCARFTTSACVADPAFLKQLEMMFCGYSYAVVHFNNGLHGVGYSDRAYRDGYRKALDLIGKKAPKAKLILALSTPLRASARQDKLNSQVDARNRIVLELAKQYRAVVDDLHSISKGHPEYYKDPYHYKAVGIDLQARQVVKEIRKVLPHK